MLGLALPTVLAMLTQSIVNEIDIIFFARLPQPESSNAQAALLPCLILLWLFGGSLSAISVGTQAFTGRRYAEGKPEEAGGVLLNAATFALLAGVVFTVVGYLVAPYALALLLKNEGAREAGVGYLRWRLLGVMSMAVTFAFKAFFDGIGKTHVHLVSAVVMNALNILLCLLCIFGTPSLGIPKMGMAGAGVAGVVSTYFGLAIMIGYALSPTYRHKFQPFSRAKLSREVMLPIVRLSIPSAVATVAVMTGFALFSFVAGKLDELAAAGQAGVEPVNGAATMVIVGILKLTFTACLAFGTATATLVSQSLGELDGDKAARFGWTSVKLGFGIFAVVGLVEGLLAEPILAFVSHSPSVQTAALAPMRVMAAITPLIAVGMILTQALFGAGNTRFVMIVELVLHFGWFVPLAWLLGITLGYGLLGIWLAGVAYALLLCAIMVWKFRSGDWKRIRL